MDTNLSIGQITIALRDSGLWNKRTDLMVPNVSWGLLPYEADFVVVNKSGYLTEVEIKRSWEDFKADFKKSHHHDDERVYRFCYCVPESISEKVIGYIKEQNPGKDDYLLPAVLCYTEDMLVRTTSLNNFNNFSCQKRRKLFLEEILTIARLGQLRYWSLLEKTIKKE